MNIEIHHKSDSDNEKEMSKEDVKKVKALF